MMTLRQMIVWYNTSVPLLIQNCWEDEIIRQFALANGTSDDFFAMYYSNPLRGTMTEEQLMASFEEHLDDSTWTSLAALVMYSKETALIADSAWPRHLNTQTALPVYEWKLDVATMAQWLRIDNKVRLPLWMSIVERFAIFNRLNVINSTLDGKWLWDDDDNSTEPTCTISTVDHISLDNVQDWGNLIPPDLFLWDQDNPEHRQKRHNIIIWNYMKLMAWRPLWDLTPLQPGMMERVPRPYIDTRVRHRGKWAALMLMQSIIYCRLLYYKKHHLTQAITRPYMIEPEPGHQWIPTLATRWPNYSSSETANDRCILVYTLRATTDQRIGLRNWARIPALLGDGSLVSEVIAASFIEEDFSSTAYDRKYPLRLNQMMSSGLVPQWMSLWLRQIPRVKHPALDEQLAGLIACQNPEFSTNDGRNGAYFSRYYGMSAIYHITGAVAGDDVGDNSPWPHMTYLTESAGTNMTQSVTRANLFQCQNEAYRYAYTGTHPISPESDIRWFTPDCQMFAAYPVHDTNEMALHTLPFVVV